MIQHARPTEGITYDLPADTPPTLTILELLDRSGRDVIETGMVNLDTGMIHDQAKDSHVELSMRVIDGNAQSLAALSTPDLLALIADRGFAWRDIAAVVGVSVPAIRKWRSGGSATGENSLRLASFLAFLNYLEAEGGVRDVAAWLEVPLVATVPVNRLDLLVAGRQDLVLSPLFGVAPSPSFVLDQFDPEWRSRYQSDFEVFLAEDGQRSIRPKAR